MLHYAIINYNVTSQSNDNCMNSAILTTGQFAKLARTTKRTVQWYEKIGILMAATVAENGYRAYEPRQILDFQIISLLRQLNFSLDEIEQHVKGGQSLMMLFGTKKEAINQQIMALQRMLQDMESYHDNLAATQLLVRPEVRAIPAFDIYYIATVAPYAGIRDLCVQLASQFTRLPPDATFLTIFETKGYKPQAASMRIGVVRRPGMKLRPQATKVCSMTIPAYDALVHTHQGDGSLLSLLWTELGKYRRTHHLQSPRHLNFYELELYHAKPQKTFGQEANVEFEMHLPVVVSS